MSIRGIRALLGLPKQNVNLNLWIPNFELWHGTWYVRLSSKQTIKLKFNLPKKTKRNKTDIQFDGKKHTLDCGGVLVLSKERNETIFFFKCQPKLSSKIQMTLVAAPVSKWCLYYITSATWVRSCEIFKTRSACSILAADLVISFFPSNCLFLHCVTFLVVNAQSNVIWVV